jgi:sigma-B regulation protein RsbU (phosphoserine phosphatase)
MESFDVQDGTLSPIPVVEAPEAMGIGERARLAAVRRYQILDTPPDTALDRIAALAARIFDAPIASVTIVDDDRVWFAAAVGLRGVEQVPRGPGLCASAITCCGPYAVPDTAQDPHASRHPLVQGEPALRFYAAAPITPTGTGWAR